MSDYVELNATRTLLEKGVKVQVPAPLFLRLVGKKNIWLTVHQPTAGNRLRIGEIYLSMSPSAIITADELSHTDAEILLKEHGKSVAKICAIAMLRGYWPPLLLAGWLSRYLLRKLTFRQMLVLVQLLVVGGDTKDFMDTIRYIKAVLITCPNLSQPTQGS